MELEKENEKGFNLAKKWVAASVSTGLLSTKTSIERAAL